MSDGMNKVFLLGNLGEDSELHFTQGGQAVLNFRMATAESWLDKDGERKERTEWHSVVVWGKRAEALERYLLKGSKVLVEGKLRTSSYEDKEGIKRYKTEVHTDELKLCGGSKGDRREEGADDRRSSDGRDGTAKAGGRNDRSDRRGRDVDHRRDDRDRSRGRDGDRRERSAGRPVDDLPY
ncbi:single-stranded DNA-binding protein [Sorangium sp. So ce1182]|uniref:single-stranded DNA-binding protein n=1 Tax=Sorangium sp. So ce1182 TaxID=3133334 RepID=UPI003F62CAC3